MVVVVVMGRGRCVTVVDALWMHWTRCERVGVIVDRSDLGSWWLWPAWLGLLWSWPPWLWSWVVLSSSSVVVVGGLWVVAVSRVIEGRGQNSPRMVTTACVVTI